MEIGRKRKKVWTKATVGQVRGEGSSLLDDSGGVGPGLQGFTNIAVATMVASQVHVGVDVLIPVVSLG